MTLRRNQNTPHDSNGDPYTYDNRQPVDAELSGPLTAFGELRVSNMCPIVQLEAANGAIPSTISTRVMSGGTAGDDDEGHFKVAIGTTPGAIAQLTSHRKARYRPGQALLGRFTAVFDTPVADSIQSAGFYNPVAGLMFGHNGASVLGICHRTGGEVHNTTQTYTTGAGGAETATITLNSVAYVVPLTAGTVQHNAYEIEVWFRANQTVWHASATNDLVCFLAYDAGEKAGTYGVSSTGTFAGGSVQARNGKDNTDTWVYADSGGASPWNIDPMDGTGPSGMTIDPTKGNVYQIEMQYLGYGAITFGVEDTATGRFVPVHRFAFANTRTTPTLRQPSFGIGWQVMSTGSTTAVTVKGASAAAFNEGKINALRNPRGFDNQRTGVGGTLVSVLAIRVRHAFNARWLLNEVLPAFASAANDGSKNCHLHLLLNPTFDPAASAPVWQFADAAESYVEYDITGTTFTDEGVFLTSRIIGGGESASLDISGLGGMALQVDDILCIAALIVSGPGAAVDASITWIDD